MNRRGTLAWAVLYVLTAPGLVLAVWMQRRLPAAADVQAARAAMTALLSLVTFALAVWFLRRDGITVRTSRMSRWVRWVVVGAAAWIPAIALGAAFSGRLVSPTPIPDGWALPIQWLFVAPAEELFFRGYLLHRLSGAGGQVNGRGLAWSSLLFGASHYAQRILVQGMSPAVALGSAVAVAGIGFGFGWIYLQSSSLPLAIVVHGWSNAPLIGPTSDVLRGLWVLGWVVALTVWRLRSERRPVAWWQPAPSLGGEG